MKCLGRRRQRPLITILGVAMVLFAASEIFIRSGGIQLRRKRCSDDAEDNLPDIIQALEEHSNLQFRIRDSQAHDKAAECKPERNVAFLKVHKCGSTTVQNILLRYGEKHNLTFVLPQRSNLISYPAKFDKRDILKFPVEKYNILTHHTRFDYEAISEVMPETTTFIAIIREPTVVFESLFTYLRIPQAMKIQGPDALDKFLSNPERHISRVSTDSYVFTMKNPLLLDFGMSTWDMHDMRKVARKIKDIDSIFSLVMLSEYFDESLVLLKHLLCWDLDDFTYVTLNRRGEASVRNVTEQTARRMRQWNRGDQLLYDYFNQTFWRKVRALGLDQMDREVKMLRDRRKAVYDMCVEKESDNTKGMWRPAGIKVMDFVLRGKAADDELCKSITRPELVYTEKIRQQQLKKYGMTKP